MNIKLPPLGPHDHPDPRSFKWDELEIRAIQEYAREAVRLNMPPDPPPEAQTEAEKTAYAFGWFKAMEQARKDMAPLFQDHSIPIGQRSSTPTPLTEAQIDAANALHKPAPLSDEQIKKVFDSMESAKDSPWFMRFARAIESAIKGD